MKPALFLALALSACTSSGSAAVPKADAPAYSGVGVVMIRNTDSSSDGTARNAKIDQSGAVGASAAAKSEATTTVEVPAEVMDTLLSAAEAALTGGSPEAAKAILGAAKNLNGGGKSAPAKKAVAKVAEVVTEPKDEPPVK